MRKTIEDKIKELEAFTDKECKCDTEYPWATCLSCTAANALNRAYNIIDEAHWELIGVEENES